MTLTNRVYEYVKRRGPEGASRAEIAEHCGTKVRNLNLRLQRKLLPSGMLIQAGPHHHYRFFTDQLWADAYLSRVPDVLKAQADRATESRRQRQREYQQGIRVLSKVLRVEEAIKMAGSAGMSRKEVDAALGANDCSDSICNAVKQGRVFAGGPLRWRRYYAEKQWAEAWDVAGVEFQKAHNLQIYKANVERNKPSKRARDAKRREELRAQREKLTQLRKNALTVVGGRDAPVNIKAPTRADLKSAQIVIPPHVKIQRCQPWTHDVRYQVQPGRRIIGEYTAEWRQRRSA